MTARRRRSTEVDELLLRLRGLVGFRAILELRGASAAEVSDEIERVRWQLAERVREAV